MYKEIHPYVQDTLARKNDFLAGVSKPSTEYFRQTESMVLETGTIRRMIPENPPDGSIRLTRLVISDDRTEDILIGGDEAEQIKKTLLAGKTDNLAKEVERLASAVRSLWELLRARMR